MNLASVWRAPVLFVVENNGIAQTTETRHTLGGSIEARGSAFGLRTWQLSDVAPDFCRSVDEIVQTMRDGQGPGMLVIETARLGPHSRVTTCARPPNADASRQETRSPRWVVGCPKENARPSRRATWIF